MNIQAHCGHISLVLAFCGRLEKVFMSNEFSELPMFWVCAF
jgi:hypothetical protein